MEKLTDYKYVAGRLRASMRNNGISIERFINDEYDRFMISAYLDGIKEPSHSFIRSYANILKSNVQEGKEISNQLNQRTKEKAELFDDDDLFIATT